MSTRVLMKGNEALAEAAIIAGCRYYFGYPVTPQNEIPEYMSKRLPEVGGVFVQAESETASINMVLGAAAAGARTMTSSSSLGISLMQEGISYLAGQNLPAVIVNVMRAGPGLGDITVAQSDYFQATRGGGHGDYRTPTLLPGNVQEFADMAVRAFDIADEFTTPVMILADATIGQMMETLTLPAPSEKTFEKPWALTGAKGRPQNIARSLWLYPDREVESNNYRLREKYQTMAERYKNEYELFMADDARYLFAAYGTSARLAKEAIRELRNEGIKAGLFRPLFGYPYPSEGLQKAAKGKKFILAVEMSLGQMVEDVRLSVGSDLPVHFYGRTGGGIPSVSQIVDAFKRQL